MLHYSYMIFLIFVGAPRGPKGGALPGPKETGFQGPRKGPRRAWGMSRAQGRNPSRAQGDGRSRAQGKCPLGYRPGGPMNAQTRDGHQGPGYGDPINQGGGVDLGDHPTRLRSGVLWVVGTRYPPLKTEITFPLRTSISMGSLNRGPLCLKHWGPIFRNIRHL